jgi:hypothetical protein
MREAAKQEEKQNRMSDDGVRIGGVREPRRKV